MSLAAQGPYGPNPPPPNYCNPYYNYFMQMLHLVLNVKQYTIDPKFKNVTSSLECKMIFKLHLNHLYYSNLSLKYIRIIHK